METVCFNVIRGKYCEHMGYESFPCSTRRLGSGDPGIAQMMIPPRGKNIPPESKCLVEASHDPLKMKCCENLKLCPSTLALRIHARQQPTLLTAQEGSRE